MTWSAVKNGEEEEASGKMERKGEKKRKKKKKRKEKKRKREEKGRKRKMFTGFARDFLKLDSNFFPSCQKKFQFLA